ncbi:unnamed protein product [Blepharisma stoltei]|uniref:Tetratricopeptide repeat protein n=1 Tax=Blepharisma stoltei TaxID=1481888 RepID=A0AAU9I9S3_9CILI|nr:unnamed protein product [Blepharisma stoltei]
MEEKINVLKREGNYKQAIEILEQDFITLDKRSAEYQETTTSLCELYNLHAMDKLHQGAQNEALSLLKKAEELSGANPDLLSATYNNYACYYKKQAKYRTALKFLQDALSINPTGDVHLNLCAVSSLIGKHDKALEYAMQAVILIQDEAFQAAYEQDFATIDIRAPILAIAFHNVAVEMEYLKRYEESLDYYRRSVDFAEKYLSKGHSVIDNLKNAYDSAVKTSNFRKTRLRNKERNENFKRIIVRAENKSKSPFIENRELSPFLLRAKTPESKPPSSNGPRMPATERNKNIEKKPKNDKQAHYTFHNRKYLAAKTSRGKIDDLVQYVQTEPSNDHLDTSEEDNPRPRKSPVPFSQEKLKEYQNQIKSGRSNKKLDEYRENFLMDKNIKSFVADLKNRFKDIVENTEK